MQIVRKGFRSWVVYSYKYHGAIGQGKTRKAALNEYENVLVDWVALRIKNNLPIEMDTKDE